jgi:hypothetical protein
MLPRSEKANMDGKNASASQNVLAKMRSLLDELDEQSHVIAAAYVAQAIEVIEGQTAADRESRV